MAKTNTLNFEALSEIQEKDDIENRLARLWATAAKHYKPNTEVQHEFAAKEGVPYPELSPDMAIALFMKESKLWKRSKGPAKFFENQLRDHDITIYVDHIEIEGQQVVPTGGSLVELTNRETTARDCANLITLYTRVKGESDRMVTEASEKKLYDKAGMPALKTTALRYFLENTTPDTMKARDEMYMRMVGEGDLLTLIYCTSKIYCNDRLKPYRSVSARLLRKYNKDSAKAIAEAVKLKQKDPKVVVPKWPTLTEAYTLHQADFPFTVISDPDLVWRFYNTSTTVRGGQKHLGALTKGYYRFDISPPIVSDIEEATDVIMIVTKFKFNAVMLEIADVKLACILNYNGITVYCAALNSHKEENQKEVGTYSRGKRKFCIYRALDQEPPSIKKNDVQMPKPVTIGGNQPTFVVEHIPHVEQGGMAYLPSCRVSMGICIKTNIKVGKNKASLDVLRERFGIAVYYRNWFLITRYTFVSQDVYKNWFNASWVLPRIKEDLSEDYFADGVKKVATSGREIRELDLEYTEQDDLATDEPGIEALSQEEEQILLNQLSNYSMQALVDFSDSVRDSAVPVDDEMYRLYSYYQKEVLLLIVKDKIDELKSIEIDTRKEKAEEKCQKKKEDHVSSDSSSDSSDADDDYFSGGQPRVAKRKGKTQEEKPAQPKSPTEGLI